MSTRERAKANREREKPQEQLTDEDGVAHARRAAKKTQGDARPKQHFGDRRVVCTREGNRQSERENTGDDVSAKVGQATNERKKMKAIPNGFDLAERVQLTEAARSHGAGGAAGGEAASSAGGGWCSTPPSNTV